MAAGIYNIDILIMIYVDPIGIPEFPVTTAGRTPFSKKISIWAKHLNSSILLIYYVDMFKVIIYGYGNRPVELSVASTMCAPFRQKTPIWTKHLYSVIPSVGECIPLITKLNYSNIKQL